MRQRIEKLKERIRHFQLDALLITSLANLRYLFGFTGSSAIALVASDLCFFVTDRRYINQAKMQVHGAELLFAIQDLFGELKKIKLKTGMKVGVEAIHLSVKNYSHLKKTFPEIHWVATERVVERIASLKEPDEVASIRRAADLCGKIYLDLLPLIEPGMRELDISAEISYRCRRNGSERDPFEPIVASGKRSALPHGISSSKMLEGGDSVILDFGAVIDGYAADVTRTVVVGESTAQQKEMARIVEAALRLAESMAKPGIAGKQLDAVVRDFMKQNGYSDFFQHSLGHGLGLEVHGLPRIGELSEDSLETGNVVALEPGIYVPEVGGVRFEDNYVVHTSGVENLSRFSRELVSVG